MNANPRLFAAAWLLTLIPTALFPVSTRAQTTWTADPENPLIPNTLTRGYALSPSVLYDEVAGIYRMWFTAHEYGGPWSIFYATSEDGSHWFSYAKNPVLTGGSMPFESDGVIYAGVMRDGGLYRMYYTGLSGCCGTAVGLATSPDGINWTKHAGNPVLGPSAGGWDAGGIGASTGICRVGSTYHLFYQAVAATAIRSAGIETAVASLTIDAATTQQIGLATSTDGISFTKSAANPVIPRGGAGAWDELGVFPGGVFVHDGTFYFFYAGATVDGSKESLGLATSTDGVQWTEYPLNPVFTGGATPPAWDWNVGSATPVVRDGTIHIWYAGNSQAGNAWSIGHATGSLDLPTATRAALVTAQADAGGVHLVWEGVDAMRVTVLRRERGAEWTALGTGNAVSGRVRWDDHDVVPGRSYAYAIGRPGDTDALLTPETWIDVPDRPGLELRGAVPNPAAGGITASFVLPTAGHVSLELFDMAGRRVRGGRDLDLPAGAHLLPIAAGDRLTPGVYVMRMAFGGSVLESRVVAVR